MIQTFVLAPVGTFIGFYAENTDFFSNLHSGKECVFRIEELDRWVDFYIRKGRPEESKYIDANKKALYCYRFPSPIIIRQVSRTEPVGWMVFEKKNTKSIQKEIHA